MAIREVSEAQLIDRLQIDNPWWAERSISSYYQRMRRRLYFDLFYPLIRNRKVNRAVVLMGPRRVGKTVMIFHAIQRLIEEGVEPKKIFYLSIETPVYTGIAIEQLFHLCRKAVGKSELDGFYVFFDEVQYLKGWEIHLKSLVDTYYSSQFIVSGSAAAALKLKSVESGAGRFTDFTLPPLTFHEYIHLRDLEGLIVPTPQEWMGTKYMGYATFQIEDLNKHFIKYMNFGGYPEVSLSSDIQLDPTRYIKSDIIDKVLLRDLPMLYGIQDVQELNRLFTTIAFNTGAEFSYERLSVSSGVSTNTIKKYINYLEAAFLLKVVHRIDQNGKKFKRANHFKIYLTNPSLRSALFSPVKDNSEVIGNLVETAIYSQWFHRHWTTPYYARWKNGEVDIVGLSQGQLKPTWAVEIKWSDRYFDNVASLKSLNSFARKNGFKDVIVTSKTIDGSVENNDIKFKFIPSALYCYTVGRRTLEQK